MKNIVRIYLFVLVSMSGALVQAQEPDSISLPGIIEIAQLQSISARQAKTLQTTRYWEWKSYKAELKPQLVLDGTLADFNRIFQPVQQPDGAFDFKPVFTNNAVLGVSLSQSIPFTGGSLFLQSQVRRFDNFNPREVLYSGVPIAIGIDQPLFQFNPWKWDNQIEPLKYEESKQQYIEDLGDIAVESVRLFFNLVSAQINWQIASTNKQNTDTLLVISEERYKLGKIARNDLLQLKLETLNARKSLASAELDLKNQGLRLRSFIGYRDASNFNLILPEEIPDYQASVEKALQEAYANRPDAIGFERQRLEAERDVAQAKGTTGLQMSLIGTFGLSNSGNTIGSIYDSPQDAESVQLTMTLPIMDWGRAKSRIETSKANRQFVQFQVEQDQINFEQEVITQVTLLETNRTQVELTAEADRIATERYGIAQQRFILGDLNITDLSIALQEKDRAKRDYILALWDFWLAHYNLQRLTLFDFITEQKL